MNILDFISMSTGLLYIIPLGLYLITYLPIHLWVIPGIAGTTLISETLKHIIGRNNPRPQGAANCNLLCNDGYQAGKPGMPSSHSATAAFFSGFYFQYTENIYIKILLVAYMIIVMMERYIRRCHTISQVLTGATLGIGLSKLATNIVREL